MKVGEAVDWGFLHTRCASNLKRRTSLVISPLIHNWFSTCDWEVPRGLYATNLVESTNARGMTSLVRTLKTVTHGASGQGRGALSVRCLGDRRFFPNRGKNVKVTAANFMGYVVGFLQAFVYKELDRRIASITN